MSRENSVPWLFGIGKRGRHDDESGYTVLDPSVGQDPSVGHFKFLAHFWLNYYQIKYMMSSTVSLTCSNLFFVKILLCCEVGKMAVCHACRPIPCRGLI